MESYLTPQNNSKSELPEPNKASSLEIRHAKKEELGAVSDLIVRVKRLNNEFDPLFAVVADVKERADKYLLATIGVADKLLLVAVEGPKVVGVLRAEMRERLFYEPHEEGFITEFYILPEYRRKALGNDMLQKASSELKKMGAQIIVGEVPSQNEIANRFYIKRGFRGLLNVFGNSS
jgi:ribosomal protein S18 acetylase RimI-like enzyme